MNLKRVLFWGLIYWLVAYSLGNLIYFSPGVVYINKIFLVLAPVLTLLFAWLYFRKSETRSKVIESLEVGIIWVILSVVLDSVFIVWMINRDYAGYFGRWAVWFGYLEMMILVVIMGLVFQRRVGPREVPKEPEGPPED